MLYIIHFYLIILINDFRFTSRSNYKYKLTKGECVLLAAVLCATDSVAALAIVKETEFPLLNSILFGEGVVNDAVSILIFSTV